MFTGIIESVAKVRAHERGTGSSRLLIETGFEDLALGESVAVNGACLTVAEVSRSGGEALFCLSPETLARTSLARLAEGSRVNLERALPASGRLSGHIVQGHVDGTAALSAVRLEGESHELEFELPQALGRYCVEK